MDLPSIGDGTVTLRPFGKEDARRATDWIAGPGAEARSATDGGPTADDDRARSLTDDLRHSSTWAVDLDNEACGWVHLRSENSSRGHLQLILAEPRLWIQGIGSRVVRLVQTAGFEHLGLDELLVSAIPESAEAARVAFEDAGFGMTARRMDPEEDRVLIDFLLDCTAYQATEQRILLVHHGRTAAEADGRLSGLAIDAPLDHVGRAQAEALGRCHLLFAVDECISSPLQRARATAEQAFAARDVPCTIDEDWADRDWGDWSGKPAGELPRSDAGGLADPPGGETAALFEGRLRKALEALPFSGNLAVVSHGAAIATVVRLIEPALAEAPGLGSGLGISGGSVTELHRGPGGWRVIRIADDRHQQAREATVTSA